MGSLSGICRRFLSLLMEFVKVIFCVLLIVVVGCGIGLRCLFPVGLVRMSVLFGLLWEVVVVLVLCLFLFLWLFAFLCSLPFGGDPPFVLLVLQLG